MIKDNENCGNMVIQIIFDIGPHPFGSYLHSLSFLWISLSFIDCDDDETLHPLNDLSKYEIISTLINPYCWWSENNILWSLIFIAIIELYITASWSNLW